MMRIVSLVLWCYPFHFTMRSKNKTKNNSLVYKDKWARPEAAPKGFLHSRTQALRAWFQPLKPGMTLNLYLFVGRKKKKKSRKLTGLEARPGQRLDQARGSEVVSLIPSQLLIGYKSKAKVTPVDIYLTLQWPLLIYSSHACVSVSVWLCLTGQKGRNPFCVQKGCLPPKIVSYPSIIYHPKAVKWYCCSCNLRERGESET